jgi:glycosyltransferase involved in cell wall biosynthesis
MNAVVEPQVSALRPPPALGVAATVIVPAYNEEAGIAAVLQQLAPLREQGIQVVVVDDASTDRTALVAEAAGALVVRRRRNGGKGAALRSGLARTDSAKVITIDADGTYPVSAILPIVRLLDDYDIALGVRTVGRGNIPLVNRFGNAALRLAIRAISGFSSADPLTGLYGIRREHLGAMALHSDGFGIEAEIAVKSARLGLRHVDHPIRYAERIGQSKLNPLWDGVTIAMTIVRLALDGSFTRLSRLRRRRELARARRTSGS